MSAGVRYRVVKKLAQGGMAEIFLALQSGAEGFQKPVVLKRILPALASDPGFVRMLVDEAHIASTLNHSNLVQVLDFRHSGSEYFLVLEFVDGWSLEQVRRRAQKARWKFPLPHILYIASSLCRALAYVHARKRDGEPLGIVHRDVTPQNVLLSCEGEVKLADFGIAKAAGKREKSTTGVIKGKFAYMSPEQASGLELDARSDLFSVGTLLYVLTTGKKPFDGPTDIDVIMQVRKARFEKPSTLVRDYNLEVEKVIVRALRANLERRWQTAEQIADKLDAIRATLPQQSGPAALKRWLESLSERDGVRPAADASVEEPSPSDVVPLTTRDLDLEAVAAPATIPGEPIPRPEGLLTVPGDIPTIRRQSIHHVPTRIAPTQTAELAELTRTPVRGTAVDATLKSALLADGRTTQQTRMEDPAEREDTRLEVLPEPELSATALAPAPLAEPLPEVSAEDRAASDNRPVADEVAVPGFFARVGRAVRRLIVSTLVVATLGAVGLYFARPYMPAWMAVPVNGWLHRLPWPVSDETPP